jgi:hypothetical protein
MGIEGEGGLDVRGAQFTGEQFDALLEAAALGALGSEVVDVAADVADDSVEVMDGVAEALTGKVRFRRQPVTRG